MASAIFEKVNSSTKVVIQKFPGACLAIHSGKDAGIRRTVNEPVCGRKCSQVILIADVSDADINTK